MRYKSGLFCTDRYQLLLTSTNNPEYGQVFGKQNRSMHTNFKS